MGTSKSCITFPNTMGFESDPIALVQPSPTLFDSRRLLSSWSLKNVPLIEDCWSNWGERLFDLSTHLLLMHRVFFSIGDLQQVWSHRTTITCIVVRDFRPRGEDCCGNASGGCVWGWQVTGRCKVKTFYYICIWSYTMIMEESVCAQLLTNIPLRSIQEPIVRLLQ